jgi:hypothetical protein
VSSSRWLLKIAPHWHFIQMLHGLPDSHSRGGTRCPASQSVYFRAVQSRSSRHAKKSASVRFARKTRQAASKAVALPRRSRQCLTCSRRAAARIKSAVPAPGLFGCRIARAKCDRSGVDIAPVDQPCLLVGVTVAAAGEGGHGPIEALIGRTGKPLGIGARWEKSGEIAQFHRREIGQRENWGAPFGSLASGEFGGRPPRPFRDFHAPKMKMPLRRASAPPR